VAVELGDREPLDVDDVNPPSRQLEHAERMLGDLDRHPQPGAAEQAGGDGVEEEAAAVSIGLGHGAEAKAGGDQLDVLALGGERGAEVMVVVRAAEPGRVGDDDAHRGRLSRRQTRGSHTARCG
jgi:hypothetical protein